MAIAESPAGGNILISSEQQRNQTGQLASENKQQAHSIRIKDYLKLPSKAPYAWALYLGVGSILLEFPRSLYPKIANNALFLIFIVFLQGVIYLQIGTNAVRLIKQIKQGYQFNWSKIAVKAIVDITLFNFCIFGIHYLASWIRTLLKP